MRKFMTEFKDKDEEKAASEAEDDPEPDINEQTLEVLNNISTISVPCFIRAGIFWVHAVFTFFALFDPFNITNPPSEAVLPLISPIILMFRLFGAAQAVHVTRFLLKLGDFLFAESGVLRNHVNRYAGFS